MSSTRCQPLLKRSGPRNRLASPQIRDHLPHIPRSISHSHPFNSIHTSFIYAYKNPKSLYTSTHILCSQLLLPTLRSKSYAQEYHLTQKSSPTTQNMSATISTPYLVASIVIGTLLSYLSIGLVLLLILGREFEGL